MDGKRTLSAVAPADESHTNFLNWPAGIRRGAAALPLLASCRGNRANSGGGLLVPDDGSDEETAIGSDLGGKRTLEWVSFNHEASTAYRPSFALSGREQARALRRAVSGGDEVRLIAIVGEGADALEDEIDWLVVGDGNERQRFVVTSSHPSESLAQVMEFATG